MWALEYNHKLHGQILAIPFNTKEDAEAAYNKIKVKVGVSPYNYNEKKEVDFCVELVVEQGITTIDCSCISAVWIINTDAEIITAWEHHVAQKRKIFKDTYELGK